MNSVVTNNTKRIMAGNITIVVALFVLTFGCWNEIVWYEFMAPLGTLISFLALAVALLLYVDIKEAIKDRELWLVAIGCIIALVNILIVKSGFGAFFTAADVLLMLYLSDKIKMPPKMLLGVGIYLAFFFYYWTFDVKGYFKGYNTNYGGLVLITGFAFAIVLLNALIIYLKKKSRTKLQILVTMFLIFMYAWGYNIISWYRARCALLGLVVIAFLSIVPIKVWTNKVVYTILSLGVTFGAIAISIVYIWLGYIKDVFTIQIFYKDILSGRDEIWGELWRAYLEKPLTGIGSSYVMQLSWMGGMFEVHNGLLDILIVHGIIVFLIVCVILLKKILQLRSVVASNRVAAMSMAGIMAILGASFMENFFIVPPFLLCFLIMFVYIRQSSLIVDNL